MKVKELTVEELKNLVEEAVEEKLEEMIGDPDLGLELREEIKERLRKSAAARQAGEKDIPVDEVARRAGLDW
jgi:signal recognition particle GTPase